MASRPDLGSRPVVLVVGGGYVGLYTALRLQRKLSRGRAEIVVVDPQPHMTYQPFLPEAAAGSVEPRHVVVPLRRTLPRCRVVTGAVVGLSHADRRARVLPAEGDPYELSYDVLVMAAGSVARTLPIPGLAEHGIGFKTVGEAIYLRNHVLARLDAAASTDDPRVRQRALTFTFVGGGYAGIEAFAELEDMARYAVTHYYPRLSPGDMRWVLVEATGRILPEVDLDMAAWTVKQLTARGMDVRLNTRLESVSDGVVRLSDGEEYASDTLVWTAGTKPNPLLASTDLPLDERGRVRCEPTLQVSGLEDAWAAGDLAAVPDLTKPDPGATTAPNAQHAVRQAKRLADNVAATLRGEQPRPYRHAYAGSVASLGLHEGVAQVYGVKLKGWPAWFMHRSYHVSRVPTFNRKARVVADWTLASLFRREVVALGQLQDPRREFVTAATSGGTAQLPSPSPADRAQAG
ncbi:NADH dehydrogenase FAD-containing subunit [Geodermatophilus normandii]|uniref:NADH dehydrogenase FAD-containing subunit n=1 Tax=Geodermatophilus normandii TaxID=1137989 RepID=A0A317QGC5_9ACTN|nr:FAD-dependent oxidoreductase [Geodermatophilus normandii]PWW21355.1 NADH dehydrogenase FAD-containing subunit [Geodermatophilus normandii]